MIPRACAAVTGGGDETTGAFFSTVKAKGLQRRPSSNVRTVFAPQSCKNTPTEGVAQEGVGQMQQIESQLSVLLSLAARFLSPSPGRASLDRQIRKFQSAKDVLEQLMPAFNSRERQKQLLVFHFNHVTKRRFSSEYQNGNKSGNGRFQFQPRIRWKIL